MTRRLSRRTSTLLFYRELTEQLDGIRKNIHRILRTQELIVSNQEQLDQRVAALGPQIQEVLTAIEDLRNQPQAEQLDWSGLDAAVQQIADIVPDAEPQPEPEPEPEG